MTQTNADLEAEAEVELRETAEELAEALRECEQVKTVKVEYETAFGLSATVKSWTDRPKEHDYTESQERGYAHTQVYRDLGHDFAFRGGSYYCADFHVNDFRSDR